MDFKCTSCIDCKLVSAPSATERAVTAEHARLSRLERVQAGLERQSAANPQPICETIWETDELC